MAQYQAVVSEEAVFTVDVPPGLPAPSRVEVWFDLDPTAAAEAQLALGAAEWDAYGRLLVAEATLTRDGEDVGALEVNLWLDRAARDQRRAGGA